MNNLIRLVIRGYAEKKLVFQERADIPTEKLEDLLPDLAARHGQALAAHELHMIEIEFLDEPNQQERFFRIGTDPSGMVMPLKVNLNSTNRP